MVKKTEFKLNWKKYFPLIIALIILFIGFIFLKTKSQEKHEEEIHYHAGFMVYIDGKLQDFSEAKFMSIAPCSEESDSHQAKSKVEEQLEKAHLHDNIGDVVHVHRKGAFWGDLFKNIGFEFPDKKLKAFINGKPIADIL